jgi:hypothetical protein
MLCGDRHVIPSIKDLIASISRGNHSVMEAPNETAAQDVKTTNSVANGASRS